MGYVKGRIVQDVIDWVIDTVRHHSYYQYVFSTIIRSIHLKEIIIQLPDVFNGTRDKFIFIKIIISINKFYDKIV